MIRGECTCPSATGSVVLASYSKAAQLTLDEFGGLECVCIHGHVAGGTWNIVGVFGLDKRENTLTTKDMI